MPKETFRGTMIRIHVSEEDQWQGKPLYRAIVDLCLESGIAGATVLQGIEGFGRSAQVHKAGFWPFSRHLPVMITIVDREQQVAELLPKLDAMIGEGIIAISAVEVIRFSNAPAADPRETR